MSYIGDLSPTERDALRQYLLKDFKQFNRFIFKIQTGQKWMDIDYHHVLFKAAQMLIEHKSSRMIVNIPPRGSKTSIFSIALPLYAWCNNPNGSTILTGFNQSVLNECSGYIRMIMQDEDFQAVFPDVVIDMNKKSAERLGTMSAGTIHAVPSTGRLTGLGAGTLSDEFSGLIAADDWIKPQDCLSEVEREKSNFRYTNTLLSRLAQNETPCVVIAQRLHTDDLCGFLLRGGDKSRYHWLCVPGIITEETGSEQWYQDQIDEFGYENAIPITYNLRRREEQYDLKGESSFWPKRKSMKALDDLKESDPYTFRTQYLQKPASFGTAVLDHSNIPMYDELDKSTIKRTFLTADTASTKETYSDPSVACFWGVSKTNELVLIDIIKGKWEVPDLIERIREFWREKNQFDTTYPLMTPRAFYIEDKASGLFLNQQYTKDGSVTVQPVPRDGTNYNNKFDRFLNTVPYFVQGRITLPRNHELIKELLRELVGMNKYGNDSGHDDFCDNVSDAVAIAFSQSQLDYSAWYQQ